MNVVFICTGNSCRSPMAAAYFKHLCDLRGLNVEVTSAGTSACHGMRISSSAITVLSRLGLKPLAWESRQLDQEIIRRADLIVAMTRSHCDWINLISPGARRKTDVLPCSPSEDEDIPDPFGGSPDAYQHVFEIMRPRLENMADRLAAKMRRPDCAITLGPDTILMFDLGGVLVQVQDFNATSAWNWDFIDAHSLERLWRHTPHPARLEKGIITAREFADIVKKEFKLKIASDEILRHLGDIVIGPFAGAEELLADLSRTNRLVCLSNTCRLHLDKVRHETRILEKFDVIFASYELGLAKPDRAIFSCVLKRLSCRPESVVFLDDREENVRAANDLGINAFQVFGPDGARRQLEAIGLL